MGYGLLGGLLLFLVLISMGVTIILGGVYLLIFVFVSIKKLIIGNSISLVIFGRAIIILIGMIICLKFAPPISDYFKKIGAIHRFQNSGGELLYSKLKNECLEKIAMGNDSLQADRDVSAGFRSLGANVLIIHRGNSHYVEAIASEEPVRSGWIFWFDGGSEEKNRTWILIYPGLYRQIGK